MEYSTSAINLDSIIVRPIEKKDNPALAQVIRSTLEEFGANRPGTVYFDKTTDELYELFQRASTPYFVAEHNGVVVGGGGIFPTEGLPSDTCELVKMYLLPAYRGIGLGKKLITKCIAYAKDAGYRQVYIESMPELQQALNTYEKFGFRYLSGPVGNTGHFGCDKWMLLEI
jgi:putative acetyltransferase